MCITVQEIGPEEHRTRWNYADEFLTTNGLEAAVERVRACMAAGLDSLKFVLNFADAQQLSRAVAGSIAFDAVISHAASARRVRDEVMSRSGHWCRLSALSIRYDDEQPSRIQPLLLRIGAMFDERSWLLLSSRSAVAPTGVLPVEDRVACKPIPCGSRFTEAHVRTDGCLSACGLDASDRFIVGDLTQARLAEAWHSDAFRALRATCAGRCARTVSPTVGGWIAAAHDGWGPAVHPRPDSGLQPISANRQRDAAGRSARRTTYVCAEALLDDAGIGRGIIIV